jgi:hypothetical protein
VNRTRHQELLGRLLEGELTGAEAEEMARSLSASPALQEDLRQHLVLWELWSQHQAAERSAESFVSAWKTRLRAESEGVDAFTDAVRKRIQSPGMIEILLRACRAMIRRPAGIAWTVSLLLVGAVTILWFAAPRSAHAMATIEGEAVCTACVLHESHQHMPAIRVAHGGATRIYYLDRNRVVVGLQDYFCNGPTPAVAKGKTRMDHRRRLFNATTVTLPEADKSGTQPTNDDKTIFPI